MKQSLTDAVVKRIKAPASGQVEHFDKGYPGLALRASYAGGKSWTYHYRHSGRPRRLTLGTYPAMTLAQARESWRAARAEAQAGRDPAGAAKTKATSTDFESVLVEWLRRDQAGNRSAGIVEKTLRRDVLPHWLHRQIGEIGRRDVLDVIDSIVDRGAPVMARRTFAYLRRLFAWSLGRGIITSSPLVGLPMPGSETKRERVLSDDELVKVWRAAETLAFPYAPAFQMLILTGARREEVGQLRWSEIADDCIKLDGTRTKNGEPHIIPLSLPALNIIEGLPRKNEFLFASGNRPVSAWFRAKDAIDKIAGIDAWRIHDLRRTCATGLQKLQTPLPVTEAILGHSGGSRGGIVGIYQRHDYANEKRAALESWGARVISLVEGRESGAVLPLAHWR